MSVKYSSTSKIVDYRKVMKGKNNIEPCPFCGTLNKTGAFRCKNEDCLEILPFVEENDANQLGSNSKSEDSLPNSTAKVADDTKIEPPESRMIEFTCKHCQTLLQAQIESSGKVGECPTCHSKIEIPLLQPTGGVVPSLAVSLTPKLSKQGIVDFVSELTTYYMDFLETNFHKRRVPKRSVKFRNSKNLRVGLDLAKYGAFKSSVLKVFESGMSRQLSISRGKYRAVVPQKVKDQIVAHTRSISNEVLSEVAISISNKITGFVNPETIAVGEALSSSLDFATEAIRSSVVAPFVRGVESLLQSSSGADIESVYSMEEDLVEILADPLEEIISEWVTNVFSGHPEAIADQILQVLDGSFVRDSIGSYFSSFSVGDLFFEIKELVDNNLILDKQELYLYFCDIHFLGEKYPLFYVPLTITKKEGSFHVLCEPVVYINKKAIEYIVQEFNKEREQKGTIKSIAERIIYPQEHSASTLEVLGDILSDIVDYFRLSPEIGLTNHAHQEAQGLSVVVSNSIYICIFDKSDEAMVNDYEEILELMKSQDVALTDKFKGLINDFISSSPKSFQREVYDKWDGTPPEQKLVFSSPIPLNPEQRQVLLALENQGCKYIAVEGPPGTGKSHTITTIVFQAILRNQSILVLSDKKEALDVVEEKITDVMNRVRISDDFQNPILRLGKTGNTYSQILSTPSLSKIRMNFRAVRSQEAQLEEELSKRKDYLTTNIDATIASYGNIEMSDISTLIDLEGQYGKGENYPLDFCEVLQSKNSIEHIEKVRQSMAELDDTLHDDINSLTLLDLFESICGSQQGINTFSRFLVFSKVVQNLRETCQDRTFLKRFRIITEQHINLLNTYLEKYRELGSGIFRYFLKGKKVAKLSQELNAALPLNLPVDLKKDLEELERASAFCGEICSMLKDHGLLSFLEGPLPIIHELMLPDEHLLDEIDLDPLSDDLKAVLLYTQRYPHSAEKIGLSPSSFRSCFQNDLYKLSEDDYSGMITHIFIQRKLTKVFQALPVFDYTGGLSVYQYLLTNRMTNILDERLLNFYDNYKATAKILRGIIRKKQRFPKNEFEKLKEAFPCIVAGIRDYAEYIPLEPEMFDIVIIDEASQVSIAQAFPALLRAKKIIVFGDKKQFSNVKSAHARSDTNREYLNHLNISFKKNVSTGTSELERLKKFNIKTSILEFFEFIANFEIMLRKHFRGYRELISYSSKYFYRNDLQAIRIRGKPIEDTIKFSFIEHDGKQELVRNINTLECDFILNQLHQLKAEGSCCSVGIITPHTNQQKLIASAVSDDLDQDYFYENLRLKIMTFDTCQGDERDIIFYSMVATPVEDKLWGVFIKDLDSVDLEDGGQIKAQRLNVGFSRAKERLHFVLSKPIEGFTGSIGQALRHYSEVLRDASKLPDTTDVDVRSPMEAKVLEWIKNTAFFQNNSRVIELKAQFPIGDYLKQLDPYYDHPAYRVDFLLLFRGSESRQHSIIIEYDGFSEHYGHFTQNADVNELNYESYYTAAHVEREKILEGYGYKFLRINRFNLGEDPILTLNERFLDLTRDKPKLTFARAVHKLIASQEVGHSKECPKCGKLLPIDAFADSSLETGVGRICNKCKARSRTRRRPARRKTKKQEAILNIIGLIEKAIKGNNTITVIYNSPRDGMTCRDIDPYKMDKSSLDRIYVLGYCHLAKSMRTFRLDRFIEVMLQVKTFTIPQNIDINAPIESFFNYS